MSGPDAGSATPSTLGLPSLVLNANKSHPTHWTSPRECNIEKRQRDEYNVSLWSHTEYICSTVLRYDASLQHTVLR